MQEKPDTSGDGVAASPSPEQPPEKPKREPVEHFAEAHMVIEFEDEEKT